MKVSNYSPKEKYLWRAKGILFVFVLSALYSCVSLKKIGIQVSVLPEYPIAEDIQSLVLLNRSMTNKFTNVESDTLGKVLLSSNLSVDSVFQDSIATDTLIQVAAGALFKSGRFDLVVPKERNIVRNDSEKIANPLNANYVNEMCRDFNVDAVLVLESFAELLNTRYYVSNTEYKNARTFDEINAYYATTDISYISEWRLYRPNDLKPVIRFQFGDSIFWSSEGNSVNSVYSQMPRIKDALIGGAIAAGLKIADYISPNWIDQTRYYYLTGNSEIDAAIPLIFDNKWEEAAVIWSKYVDIDSKTIKSKVEFNLALAAEMSGDLDLATEWGLKSFKTRYTKISEDYIKLLDNKIKAQQTESKKRY
jgi:hypothetical protein